MAEVRNDNRGRHIRQAARNRTGSAEYADFDRDLAGGGMWATGHPCGSGGVTETPTISSVNREASPKCVRDTFVLGAGHSSLLLIESAFRAGAAQRRGTGSLILERFARDHPSSRTQFGYALLQYAICE